MPLNSFCKTNYNDKSEHKCRLHTSIIKLPIRLVIGLLSMSILQQFHYDIDYCNHPVLIENWKGKVFILMRSIKFYNKSFYLYVCLFLLYIYIYIYIYIYMYVQVQCIVWAAICWNKVNLVFFYFLFKYILLSDFLQGLSGKCQSIW